MKSLRTQDCVRVSFAFDVKVLASWRWDLQGTDRCWCYTVTNAQLARGRAEVAIVQIIDVAIFHTVSGRLFDVWHRPVGLFHYT